MQGHLQPIQVPIEQPCLPALLHQGKHQYQSTISHSIKLLG